MHIASTFFIFLHFLLFQAKNNPAAARSVYKFKTAFVFFFKRLQKVR